VKKESIVPEFLINSFESTISDMQKATDIVDFISSTEPNFFRVLQKVAQQIVVQQKSWPAEVVCSFASAFIIACCAGFWLGLNSASWEFFTFSNVATADQATISNYIDFLASKGMRPDEIQEKMKPRANPLKKSDHQKPKLNF